MNLKEAFRYQKFLNDKLYEAVRSFDSRPHCFSVTKKHLRSQVNPEAEDIVETVDEGEFFPNDDVLAFMQHLIVEREKLTTAIEEAKAGLPINLATSMETNKFRQRVSEAIKYALNAAPIEKKETGSDYKFNAEGNQTKYVYPIEVTSEDAYDKAHAKDVMRKLIAEADKTSAEIDLALITANVEYEPPYDVNSSFDDVMTEFIGKNK